MNSSFPRMRERRLRQIRHDVTHEVLEHEPRVRVARGDGRDRDDLDSRRNIDSGRNRVGQKDCAGEADPLARPRKRAQRQRVVRGVDADEGDVRESKHRRIVHDFSRRMSLSAGHRRLVTGWRVGGRRPTESCGSGGPHPQDSRRPREGGDPATFLERRWAPLLRGDDGVFVMHLPNARRAPADGTKAASPSAPGRGPPDDVRVTRIGPVPATRVEWEGFCPPKGWLGVQYAENISDNQ